MKLIDKIKALFKKEKETIEHTEILLAADKLGIAYTKRGKNYIVEKCPICGEHATMYLSPKYGIYKCFRCGETGTAVGLIKVVKHINGKDAMRKLDEWMKEE